MTLVIPTITWQTALEVLHRAPHDFERIVYLDGPRPSADLCVATTVTVPNADVSIGHFRVSAQEMSRAGKHLRRFDLLRLAQIHTHPSGWVGHSASDGAMAFSQRDGVISIVIPDYAACAPGIGHCGIHIRDEAGWRELRQHEKDQAVLLVPALIDLVT